MRWILPYHAKPSLTEFSKRDTGRSADYLTARISSVSPSSELAHVACISGTAKRMPMVLIVSAKMISCKVEILSTNWFI